MIPLSGNWVLTSGIGDHRWPALAVEQQGGRWWVIVIDTKGRPVRWVFNNDRHKLERLA